MRKKLNAGGSGRRLDSHSSSRVDLAHLVLGLALLALACSACGDQRQQKTREQVLLERLIANPADVATRLELANSYYNEGLHRLAIPPYLEVLRHRPDDPAIRTDLGTCYRRLGDLAKARSTYETVLRKHPDHTQALFNLGVVAEELGDLESAVKAWEKAAASTKDPEVARMARKNAAEARVALEKQGQAGPGTAAPAK